MPVVVVFLIALWAVCMYFGLLYGFPVVAALTLAAATLAGLGHYFLRAGRVLLPVTARGASPVAAGTPEVKASPGAPQEERDPAYRHYLFGQVALDWWRTQRSAVPAMGQAARLAVAAVTRRLMSNVQGFFVFPIWLGLVVGVAAAAIPLAAVAAALTAAYALVAVAGLVLWLACLLLLLGVETVFMRVRRILQTCPHPQCYARISLPEYACPTCGRRHRHLRPNRDGVFRHVCRCGTRLPTAIVLGRFRLPAYCPECGRALPPRIGRARIEPLPFIGGPDAGKTTFMVLAINALHRVVKDAQGRAGFVVEGDEIAFSRLRRELRLGKVSKTTTRAPSATMVDVTLPGSRTRSGNRILYLFDPSGEGFTGATQVEAMSYLAHGEAMLIVVDPFALPLVQHGLSDAERHALQRAGVVLSPEDPSDTFQRVRNELAARADGGRQKRVAVVVTKVDLLHATAVGHDADRLPEWFDGVGLGNMVRDLARTAAEVRYLASGLPADEAAIAELLAWLIDLPLNGSQPAGDEHPPAAAPGPGAERGSAGSTGPLLAGEPPATGENSLNGDAGHAERRSRARATDLLERPGDRDDDRPPAARNARSGPTAPDAGDDADIKSDADTRDDADPEGGPGTEEEAELTTADLRGPWAPSRGAEDRVPLTYRLLRWSVFGASTLLGAGVLALLVVWAISLIRMALPL
ncbi:TRAFAC clade GTPase domain-containing protein [Sphaerisporangium dianthi]|uniref:Double-GTPase 2 domain-containing protein n=1 Tax=Sphaerisporangium dianthi TaxID=1436120 RepID=A0ABV9CGY5_9ACTN